MVRHRAVARSCRALSGPLLGLACLLAAACSSPNEKPTTARPAESCLNGATSGLDCRAQADLRTSTGKQISLGSKVDVSVGALKVGDQLPFEFSLLNTISKATGSPLRIDGITVRYDNQAPQETATDRAFTCLDSTGKIPCDKMKGAWRKVVPAGAEDVAKNWATEEHFRIVYKHFDDKARTAEVCLQLGGDPKWQTDDLCFTLRTLKGSARLQVQPQGIEFKYVPANETKALPLTLTNVGDVQLCVFSINFTADPAFGVAYPAAAPVHKPGSPITFEPQLCLDAGGSVVLQVTFTPGDEKKKTGSLTILSNDVSKPLGVIVPLLGNSAVPCLAINPAPQINFGAATLGNSQDRDITACSCGSEVLSVTSIALQTGGSDSFALDFGTQATPTDAAPIVLNVNECVKFKGHYTPSVLSKVDPATGAPAPESATLQVTSNTTPKTAQCLGIAVNQTCPEAKIKILEGEEVVPQTVLHLSGTQSVAPGGAGISKFLWTVKKQPEGSSANFVPSQTAPTTTFTANAAGEYVFCLKVTDSSGQSSSDSGCSDACTVVFVAPTDALHIELLWDTPGDDDQTNTGPGAGSDMDLHFANPLASAPDGLDLGCDGEGDPWFNDPFDCFWFNKNPSWGSASVDVPDDAHLDLDDTDGKGPENMNLAQPEGSVQNPLKYSIGVHYWNDYGKATSFATVRVYVLGKLTNEFKSPEMKALDMWTVGRLNWPNSAAGGGSLQTVETCQQTGDACLDAKDPKAGKMWQPLGDPCIHHCYTSPLAPSGQAFCK